MTLTNKKKVLDEVFIFFYDLCALIPVFTPISHSKLLLFFRTYFCSNCSVDIKKATAPYTLQNRFT